MPLSFRSMAQFRTSHSRPLSADFPQTKESSMLYSILPSAVQSRLPRLPSLRRSVSMYGLPTRRRSTPNSRPSSGSRTPDADYKNAMVLVGQDEDMAGYIVESASLNDEEDGGMNLEMGKGRSGQGMELSENKSGIGWKFANQGLNLLSLAVDESSTISQDSRFGNASFARQLYLHALTYLLRGLPSDLTTEEQLSVRSALPAGVVEPLRLEINPSYASNSTLQSSTQPSLLHRTLASTIVQLFIIFQFILPYLKYLLSAAYQYDREHKISEKVVAQGIETVDLVGKSGLTLGSVVWRMGEGKVGQVVGETAKWFVEGVTGGIHEGVGEGMVIIGVGKGQGLEET